MAVDLAGLKGPSDEEFEGKRSPQIRNYATLVFTCLIAVIGWAMMSITSSPGMKGAALLWLPAALQLIAGVWLGPIRGLIAGGLGAYAAGILAYGGWGLPDIIMNPVAGGLANSLLPGILFRFLRIDPSFDIRSDEVDLSSSIFRIAGTAIAVFALSIAMLKLFPGLGAVGYIPQAFILIAAFFFLSRESGEGHRTWDLLMASFICVVSSLLSAVIGTLGAVVGKLSLESAIVSVGIGWFAGDSISSLLGLYALALLTEKARQRGIYDSARIISK
jgi:hypothetical protein